MINGFEPKICLIMSAQKRMKFTPLVKKLKRNQEAVIVNLHVTLCKSHRCRSCRVAPLVTSPMKISRSLQLILLSMVDFPPQFNYFPSTTSYSF